MRITDDKINEFLDIVENREVSKNIDSIQAGLGRPAKICWRQGTYQRNHVTVQRVSDKELHDGNGKQTTTNRPPAFGNQRGKGIRSQASNSQAEHDAPKPYDAIGF